MVDRGRLGSISAWHLPGGPVGPPATSNAERGSRMGEGPQGSLARDGWLSSDKLFAGVPSF